MEKTIRSETLYSGRILDLRLDHVTLSDGTEAIREIVGHAPAVAIIPFQAPDTVFLIKQYRKAAERVLIEIPAGLMNAGEDPLETAKRELAEETGFRAKTWTPICEGFPSPGFCEEYVYFYMATDLTVGETNFDADERIELIEMSLAELGEAVHQKEIVDIKTVLAYFYIEQWVRGRHTPV